MLREAAYYARMSRGLSDFLRTPLDKDPFAAVRRQVERREENFLELLRGAVFPYPDNPFHQMFQMAGCAYGDVESMVRRDGLELSLRNLRDAGVYVTHAESKGAEPMVRSGRTIPPADFANPLAKGYMEGRSSGSRSNGTRSVSSTRFLAYRENHMLLVAREFGLSQGAHAVVRSILPSTVGLHSSITYSRAGSPVERWFVTGAPWQDSWHYRIVTHLLVRQARLHGLRVPLPAYLPPNDFSPAARWLAEKRAQGIPCDISGPASSMARIATAARELNLDIAGARFGATGEPLTEAKRAAIEAVGGKAHTRYWMSEFGPIGFSCRSLHGNTTHINRDIVAVINWRRIAPLSDAEVNSLLFTSLLPFAPKVLINAEMDDYGDIEPARCDCLFSALGNHQIIRGIGSFGKVCGQGMTLMGKDFVGLLEEALPKRFGGGPGDYQLVEHENQAQTRVTLRVNPRVPAHPAPDIRDFFLTEVRKMYGGALSARTWGHADAFRVEVAPPYTTHTGKVHPLHLLKVPASHETHT